MFHTTSPLRQETHLSLVFEHIEQDLSVYLENCPQPGLPEWKIKVCTVKMHNHMQIKTFHSLMKAAINKRISCSREHHLNCELGN